MTLARGTDRLESARLGLRRIAPDDLAFFARTHTLPEVAGPFYPGGRPRSPEETAAWSQYTLASYERLALGSLAVLRKEDGALVGRCGFMDLVAESAAPEHGIRRRWFGREGAPAAVAPALERELGDEFDPAVWARVSRPKRRVAFATTSATSCGCRTRCRPFFRRTPARGASPNGRALQPPARWKCSVSRGIATCDRSRPAVSRCPRPWRTRSPAPSPEPCAPRLEARAAAPPMLNSPQVGGAR